MSTETTEPAEPTVSAVPRLLVVAGILAALAVITHRALGWVPPDLTAYLAAVDVWLDGYNPYTDKLWDSPRADGYPFVYPPASLWVFAPLDWLSATAVAVLDGLARLAVIAGLIVWIRRRFLPEVEPGWIVAGALFCSPLIVDVVTGNLAVYMLGALAVTIELSARRGFDAGRFAAIAACGVVIAIKPMWAIPAVYAACARRRPWAVAALAVGGGGFLVASLAQRHLFVSWLARVEEVSAFYASVDFLKVAPILAPVAAVVWLAPAVWLAWKRVPDAWVFGLASVFMWPRLAVYSYLLVMPLVAWLVSRWGWRRALVAALPVLGPLPWLLRDIEGGIYERWMLLVWATLLAALVFRELVAGRSGAESGMDQD